MNWQAISFDWNQVRAFLATVEEGSFSGAARALNSTQPTIGRQISDLETSLGVTLFERSVRGPTLTDAGASLLEHVQAMGEAASMISMAAGAQSQEISGEVTVTATDMLCSEVLPGILQTLRKTAPRLAVKLVAANDIRDLMRREADIAIRHVRPDQPDLIARHIGDFSARLYASSEYLDRAGRPKTPSDLVTHDFIGVSERERLLEPLHALGAMVKPENFVVTSDNGVVLWSLVRHNFGISLLPDPLCMDVDGIESVLPDMMPLTFPVWLVTHRELRTSRRIRAVFDALADGMAALATKN